MRTRFIVAALAIAILAIAVAVARFATNRATTTVATTTLAPSAAPPSASPTPVSVPATPSAAPTSSAAPSPSAAPSLGATASPVAATPTPDANLLSFRNGAFVRRWTMDGGGGGNALAMENLYGIDPKFARPLSFEFEMPSIAHLTGVGAILRTSVPVTVRVATGTSIDDLHDAGTFTIASDDGNAEHTMTLDADARYVRATFTRSPGMQVIIFKFAAYGTPGSPDRASLAGTWAGADNATGDGNTMFPDVRGSVPYSLPPKYNENPQRTLVTGTVLTHFSCDRTSPAWHGTIANNIVTGANGARLQLTGSGKLLVGYAPDIYTLGGMVVMRDLRRGGYCQESDAGKGPTVLALERNGQLEEEEIDPAFFPGYHFHRAIPMLLDQRMLARAQFAMLIDDCSATNDLLPGQQRLLLDWVAEGHKLIIKDSDRCNPSEYAFVPYRFKTATTGAVGARGHVLSIADPSTLGSGRSDPAHFINTDAYVQAQQDLGDADIMQTDDPHWCGHMFARNANGAAGWVHAYARFGRGLIIYDGFDHDDLLAKNPPAMAVIRYEYAQSAQAPLPCNAQVASALALYPGAERKVAAGSPIVLRIPMSLTYVTRPATEQRIALTIRGDVGYPVRVSPPVASMQSGQTVTVEATISLPRGWNGVHAFTVSADGSSSKAHAQASIVIDGSVALARAFSLQRRVRIYGIHFDVGSATILPQSEATIAQIAQVLRANPVWLVRVEGYTDSDGGAAYNLALSDRRAHAVVTDLVVRYKISASRLVAMGFGLTHPVASNATAGGKALNRRVELVRL